MLHDKLVGALLLLLSLCLFPCTALAEGLITPTSEHSSSNVALSEKAEAVPKESEILLEGPEMLMERMLPPPTGQDPTEPVCGEASSFEELKLWLNSNRGGSGTLTLKSDITVPRGESFDFIYLGGEDPESLIIDAGEHSIYVEGKLLLAPCMTVKGSGGENGIFQVAASGHLDLIGVQLRGQEGVPVIVQEEGSVLICGNWKYMFENFPDFFYVGEILRSDKFVAQPSAVYFPQFMLMAEMRAGFDPALLPATIPSLYYGDPFESNDDIVDLPVVWDPATFPVQREDGSWPRTIVKGRYEEDVLLHGEMAPFCLLIFPEPGKLIFECCWVEENMGMVSIFLNAKGTASGGQVQLQSSMDGETWLDVEDSYSDDEPLEWHLNSNYNWEEEPPRYFSLVLTAPDGSIHYSDIIELGEDNTFSSMELGGGRGGETGPGEGGDHLPEEPTQPENGGEGAAPEEPTQPENGGEGAALGEPTQPENGGEGAAPGEPTQPENGGDEDDIMPKPPTPDKNQPFKGRNSRWGSIERTKGPSIPESGTTAPLLGLVLLKIPLIQVKEPLPTALPNAVEGLVLDDLKSRRNTPTAALPAGEQEPKVYAPSQGAKQKQPPPAVNRQAAEKNSQQVYAPEQGIAQNPVQVDAADPEMPKVSGVETIQTPLSQNRQIVLGVATVLIIIGGTLLIGRKWKP